MKEAVVVRVVGQIGMTQEVTRTVVAADLRYPKTGVHRPSISDLQRV